MLRTRIKICGCTSAADVALAVEAGADAVGVILAERSERRVALEQLRVIAQSVPALTSLVAVFADPSSSLVDEALKVGATPQFHGNEDAESCEAFAAGPYLKVFHVDPARRITGDDFDRFARPFEHATWMFDTASDAGSSGGTGRAFDWEVARALAGQRRFVISGGLTPENVGICVRAVRPYAVDVRSGVETKGVKDAAKVLAFVNAVRAADTMATSHMEDEQSEIDSTRAAEYVGKTILVGISYVDADGKDLDQVQWCGIIEDVDPMLSVRVGSDLRTLPPRMMKAPPGEYRLRSTAEVVSNPDFLATWTVEANASPPYDRPLSYEPPNE